MKHVGAKTHLSPMTVRKCFPGPDVLYWIICLAHFVNFHQSSDKFHKGELLFNHKSLANENHPFLITSGFKTPRQKGSSWGLIIRTYKPVSDVTLATACAHYNLSSALILMALSGKCESSAFYRNEQTLKRMESIHLQIIHISCIICIYI